MGEDNSAEVRSVEADEAKQRWNDLLNEVAGGRTRVVVNNGGTPAAVVLSVADYEHLARMEAERAARFAVIDRAREAFKDVPDEELEREVAKAVEEARAELRAELKQSTGTS